MLKRLAFPFLLLSVLITVSHAIVAHHHHFGEAAHQQGSSEEQDEDHNLFSFAPLDEIFVPTNEQLHIADNAATLCLLQAEFSFTLQTVETLTPVYLAGDYPVPDNPYYTHSSLRGPPLS